MCIRDRSRGPFPLAAATGINVADMFHDNGLGRNDFNLPPGLGTHFMQLAAARGADLLFHGETVFFSFNWKIFELLVALTLFFAAPVGDLFDDWLRLRWLGLGFNFIEDLKLALISTLARTAIALLLT